MTREQKVARAQRLRARGLTYGEIGEEMGGYQTSTVSAWINDPDRSKEIARKNSYRGTCEECGAPTDGSNGPGKAPSRCLKCEHTRNAARNQRILQLNEEGLPHWLIAEELGMTPTAVNGYLTTCRRRKGLDVPMHKLGGTKEERDQRREQIIEWRRSGLSNAEIAERLETSTASVSQMFVTARRLGLDVPERSNPCIATTEDLEARWREGLTAEQIADFYGYAGRGSVVARVQRARKNGRDFPRRSPGRRAVAA